MNTSFIDSFIFKTVPSFCSDLIDSLIHSKLNHSGMVTQSSKPKTGSVQIKNNLGDS